MANKKPIEHCLYAAHVNPSLGTPIKAGLLSISQEKTVTSCIFHERLACVRGWEAD
jgi:hypothetical protein